MCREVWGIRFLVATGDGGAGRSLYLRGQRPEMGLLQGAMTELERRRHNVRGLFVDVGANIGTTTMFALVHQGFSEVVAIEPEPTNASLLAATAALNELSTRVRIIRAAALDHTNGAHLKVHPGHSAKHKITAEEGINVPTVTLDSLHLGSVGLLWIDAEGSEGQILAGARRLLRHRPPIVLEYNPTALRARKGLDTVLEISSSYRSVVHPRTGQHLDLETLATELDNSGGKATRQTDVLFIP